MTALVTGGPLGPRAVAELRALAEQRERLRAECERYLEGLARKEATLLALTAEAAGCDSDGPFAYDLDAEPPAWRLAEEPVRVDAGRGTPSEDEG